MHAPPVPGKMMLDEGKCHRDSVETYLHLHQERRNPRQLDLWRRTTGTQEIDERAGDVFERVSESEYTYLVTPVSCDITCYIFKIKNVKKSGTEHVHLAGSADYRS